MNPYQIMRPGFTHKSATNRLRMLIAQQISQNLPRDACALSAYLRENIDHVVAIIYYGSRLRDDNSKRMFDFYVLTDGLVSNNRSLATKAIQWVISPMVATFKYQLQDQVVAVKYAMIPQQRFHKGLTQYRHSYYWARFAQPYRLLYCRDDHTAEKLIGSTAIAIRKLIGETLPLMNDQFSIRDLWVRALQETYRCEIRPERNNRAEQIYAAGSPWFETVTPLILELQAATQPVWQQNTQPPGEKPSYRIAQSATQHLKAQMRWGQRRLIGKLMSLLRLVTAILTFDGWRNYLADKIADHSGHKINLEGKKPYQIIGVLWNAWYKGAFR